VSDYLVSNMQDRSGALPGVGDINVFGAQYAMRIWLNPTRLASYADAERRDHRDPEPECRGRGRRDRRRAEQPQTRCSTRP
jgi:hypothetical protein